MAVDTFIPEVWAASLLTTLERNLVFGQQAITNDDYEGDISQFGDTVHIGSLTDPTVATYTKNSTSISPATLVTTDQSLTIDQSKYFAWEVDDIDARQVRDSGNLMRNAIQRSAFKLRDTADQFLATTMAAGAGETLDATEVASTEAAFRLMLLAMEELDLNDVPSDGRFMVCSPSFHAALLGDSRFIGTDKYGSSEPIRNGEIGRALGFTIFKSNNLPEGTFGGSLPVRSNHVLWGHPIATTYAQQIVKTEAYRPQDAFSDAVKGLHLYGAKVVRPEALVTADIDVNLTNITFSS